MYTINYNDTILYYPGDKEYCVSEAVLGTKVGESGELNFVLPPNNPLYRTLNERQIITIFQDDEEFWRGDVREITTSFNGLKSIYCLEDLAFLGEVIKYAHSEIKTREQYFIDLLNEYNSKVNEEKRFYIGYILKNSQLVQTFEHETMSILENLRLLAGEDQYVRVRRMNGKRYVDIVDLKNYNNGSVNDQLVRFGENMMDFVKESNTSWLLSSILPLGAELDTQTIENVADRVTIESVNQGSKVLVNNTAVASYGYIEKLVEFDDITDPTELKELAEQYLRENSQPRLTMEVQAVDLSTISQTDCYRLGDLIHIECEPFGIDQDVSLTELEIDLLDPSRNNLTLSSAVESKTFTSIQNKISAEVKKIPAKSEVLTAAKKNVSALINSNGTNGYVVLHENDEGVVYEILIMDKPDINTATKMWRWNQNGLGFADSKDENGEWEFDLAMTIDGQIVADFITAGKLVGIEINNGNGTFRVDENGNMTATQGTFSGSLNAATGTFSGQLNAASGTISDGTGTLLLRSGDLRMSKNSEHGAGIFAQNDAESAYSCWGATNSACLGDGAYREVPTMDILRAGENASDKRLKKDIKDLDEELALNLIMGIKPKTFKFKTEPDELCFGVIAQDIRKIEKNIGIDTKNNRLCYTNKASGKYSVDYSQLIAPLISVVQNLHNQIEELQREKT